MNAPPMDLMAADADPSKRPANRNRAPEMAGEDFSRYLDQTQEEEAADEDSALAGMMLAMPAAVDETGAKTQATAEIANTDPVVESPALPVAADLRGSEADEPQQDPAREQATEMTVELTPDDTVEVIPEAAKEKGAGDSGDISQAGGVDSDSADLSQDADEPQRDMSDGHDAPERSDPDTSGRGFSADAQALYGATTALNARHPGASAAQQAQLVSQQIVQAAQITPEGAVELALSPEELGHLKLVLHSDDGKLHVTIQAERPETQDLLRRHVDGLEKDFRQVGYSEVTFSFGEQGRDRRDGPADPMTAADAPEAESIAPPPRATLRVTGGLDLRI